MNIYIILV